MKDLTLVVLAAGMGSRFGGLKQVAGFGKNDELIIEFSIYDALAAGFNKVVLVIKEEHQELFETQLTSKIKDNIKVEYAYQSLEGVPEWFSVPSDRVKPWGTTHAVLSARELVEGPFVVINADDYYGAESFKIIADYLREIPEGEGAIVGFQLRKTLTAHGTVTRGLCSADEGYLTHVEETYGIKEENGKMVDHDGVILADDSLASMNFWGFNQSIMTLLSEQFNHFLNNITDLNLQEALLPNDISTLIDNGDLKVKVLQTGSQWFGVTYQEDKESVKDSLRHLQKTGVYPKQLWK